ncbi:hypothetical protein LTR50_002540 [Elasticomyces elasticus]|nr:hypothetical protein LTR50_002540 [Elasticomyces elasticus]
MVNGDQDSTSADATSITANEEKPDSATEEYIPGQDVQVDYPKLLEILVSFLSDSAGECAFMWRPLSYSGPAMHADHFSEEEIQLTTLRWIHSFFEICPEDILLFVPQLLSQVLPAMSHDVEDVRRNASNVNHSLMEYIVSLPDAPKTDEIANSKTNVDAQTQQPPPTAIKGSREIETSERRESGPASRARKIASPEPDAEHKLQIETPLDQPLEERSQSPKQSADLDYEAAVNALTLQFLNEHEATRVAALAWLIMLHRKAPRKILAIHDGTFPALLKTLSDPAESVVIRDLLLLSQISKNSDDSYFASFMVNLLKLFCTDRRLLETRGNLIIRQLCLNLSAERIYRTLADCLEKDEDMEFASIMVQNLNNNLITAPELSELRKRLRNLETRVSGVHGIDALVGADKSTGRPDILHCTVQSLVPQRRGYLFSVLARTSIRPGIQPPPDIVSTSLYWRLTSADLHSAELEMTVNMLIQIDKLVQLLESPVFTYLRLQLLEPEKFPHLYKCLYGLLMLLPQSSAFAALKNRLNSVSAIGYLHIAPRTYVLSTSNHFSSRQKGSSSDPPTLTLPSNPSTPSVSTFERPNRLKSREEGGIKWAELLEKFKSTQERARRAQRMPIMPAEEAAHSPPEKEKKVLAVLEKARPPSVQSIGRQPLPSALGHAKTKSGLGNLSRFTGGVAARKVKR